ESLKVLEVIFQFVYPKRHPKLQGLDFATLMEVAEAVEKYQVFSAMNICKMHLSNFLPKHTGEVFVHAMEHDYPELLDKTAIILSHSPLLGTLKTLPLHYILPWASNHCVTIYLI
ncbi:hypothetical protein CPB84DRAFT_1684917, partial [Gymnopilus junonius]